jgi:hypothetical protein
MAFDNNLAKGACCNGCCPLPLPLKERSVGRSAGGKVSSTDSWMDSKQGRHMDFYRIALEEGGHTIASRATFRLCTLEQAHPIWQHWQ